MVAVLIHLNLIPWGNGEGGMTAGGERQMRVTMDTDILRGIQESKRFADQRDAIDLQAEREALAISKIPGAATRVPSLDRTPRFSGRSDWTYHGEGRGD